MAKKTYATYGYIEYEITFDIGGKQACARFEGGSISQNGIVPAVYETANAVMQYKIESCHSYKSGRIKLIREEKAEAPKAEAAAEAAEGPAELQTIEVACLEDAVEYLKETYGMKSAKLNSKAAVEAAAKSKGIEFAYA